MALATLEEFEARHGVLGDEEFATVEALLDDASAFISGELSSSEAAWLEEGSDEPVPGVVKAVCIQVAYRAWSNPDSVAREELGARAVTYRGTDQSDALWLTKNEVRLVKKAASVSSIKSIQVETPFSGDPEETSPLDFWPIESEGS